MSIVARILVVDDEAALRELICDEMTALKFVAIPASNGKEALDLLLKADATNPIDAIISDYTMPIMNGLELLLQIRKLKLDVPFIFLSGYGDKNKVETAMKLGALDFLDKPYSRKRLVEVANKAALMGVTLRTIDKVIEQLCTAQNIAADKQAEFKATQKAAMILRAQGILNKKAA